MNRNVYHGYNERATSDIVPGSWAAPTIPPWPHDPGAARRLLDAAGWTPGPDGIRRRNGERLALAISTTTAKQSNVQAEVQMQHELRGVGIDLTIKNYPTSYLFAQNGPLYGGHLRPLALHRDAVARSRQRRRLERGLHPAEGREHDVPRRSGPHARPVTKRRTSSTARAAARSTSGSRNASTSWCRRCSCTGKIAYAAYNSDLKNYKRRAVHLEQLERVAVELPLVLDLVAATGLVTELRVRAVDARDRHLEHRRSGRRARAGRLTPATAALAAAAVRRVRCRPPRVARRLRRGGGDRDRRRARAG